MLAREKIYIFLGRFKENRGEEFFLPKSPPDVKAHDVQPGERRQEAKHNGVTWKKDKKKLKKKIIIILIFSIKKKILIKRILAY